MRDLIKLRELRSLLEKALSGYPAKEHKQLVMNGRGTRKFDLKRPHRMKSGSF
jgi:hypothetical protein